MHLTVDDGIPMRRPLSIMRADAAAGWIDVLYKVVGPGLAALSRRRVGETLSVLGPIGSGFTLHPERRRPLLLGGGVGIPPMVFLAGQMAAQVAARPSVAWQPLALFGSEIPFPFRATAVDDPRAGHSGWRDCLDATALDSGCGHREPAGQPQRLRRLLRRVRHRPR